jgi:hypothetical protein
MVGATLWYQSALKPASEAAKAHPAFTQHLEGDASRGASSSSSPAA